MTKRTPLNQTAIMTHLNLLGLKAKDVVTGCEGIVESVCFDLYGCVQIALKPPLDKDGKIQDGRWFDISRLKMLSTEPVMPVPSNAYFAAPAQDIPGPADKPIR